MGDRSSLWLVFSQPAHIARYLGRRFTKTPANASVFAKRRPAQSRECPLSLTAHPRYLRACQKLALRFRDRALELKHLSPVVFLCGARQSQTRDDLARYLKRHAPELFVFYAEAVWEHVRELRGINALHMETQLATFADILMVVVESPGTFAELGAFSARENLRNKLLPILDRAHEGVESFINAGPVAWVNKDSKYGPAIYCDLNTILLSAEIVVARTKKIPSRGLLPLNERVDPSKKPKHLLFMLSDLIGVIGPATEAQCRHLIEAILPEPPEWHVHSLLGLLTTLGLVRHFALKREPGTIQTYYFRPLKDGQLTPFQSGRFFDLAQERAAFLSVLQSIPDGQVALAGMLAELRRGGALASCAHRE